MHPSPQQPTILCFDGSEDAAHAIRSAADLLAPRQAIVLTVWQPATLVAVGLGAVASLVNFAELDRAAAENGNQLAEEGARIAREAGLEAEPASAAADGPVWKTIVDAADDRDAAMIVMGSRGLTGVRSVLLGSVSSAVVHHANRPTLVVHHDDVVHNVAGQEAAREPTAAGSPRRRATEIVSSGH